MIGRACILVVGGEAGPWNPVIRTLLAEPGLSVQHAATVPEAAAGAQSPAHPWSAIIFDAPVPETSVPAFCELIRRSGLRIPILILAESATEQEVVDALDAGAINYLLKPVGAHELTTRLRAHLRRYEASGNGWLKIGSYRLLPAARLLEHSLTHQTMRLTPRETGILLCLHKAGGAPVSQETLLHKVWHYSPRADTKTLQSQIYRLRRKIELIGASVILDDRSGYRLPASQSEVPIRLGREKGGGHPNVAARLRLLPFSPAMGTPPLAARGASGDANPRPHVLTG